MTRLVSGPRYDCDGYEDGTQLCRFKYDDNCYSIIFPYSSRNCWAQLKKIGWTHFKRFPRDYQHHRCPKCTKLFQGMKPGN